MNESNTVLNSKLTINAEIKTIWDVVKNPDYIHLYHPLIKDSLMLGKVKNGIGARRKCILLPMGEMIEKITDWQEGSSYTTEVIDGKFLPPFEFMIGTIQLKSIETNLTEVAFTFKYKLKYGIFGRMLNMLFIKPQFKSAPKKYVKGLKEYIENL